MANILKGTYQSDNFNPNSKIYDVTITLDEDINNSEVGDYLPNNGSRYKSIDNMALITTESSATIVCPSYKLFCSFTAESGSVDPITNMQEGKWSAYAKLPFLA